MTLTLFTAPNSICTQKVLITLLEKDVTWEERKIDLFRNEQYDPAYLKLNPKGVVPTLVHDGRPITESTLICEYLDQSFATPPLVPADAYARAQMRQWSKAVDEGIFEATRELSFSAMFREKMRAMTEEQRQARFRNVGDPVRRARFLSTYQDGVESPYVFQGIIAFEKLFQRMDKALASGTPWLVGPQYSLGDINVTPFVARLDYLSLLDIWLGERPAIREWWRRAKSRESATRAIAERLTGDEIAAMAAYGAKIAPRVAQLRADYLRDHPNAAAA